MRALGRRLKATEVAAVYAEAQACIGIRWRHMGRMGLPYGHQTGLDCVGFLIRILATAGRPVGDFDIYNRTGDGSELIAEMDRQLGPRTDDLKPGCIVMLMLGKENPHVGLLAEYAGETTLIHCYNPHGVIEHGFDSSWRKRVVAGWSL